MKNNDIHNAQYDGNRRRGMDILCGQMQAFTAWQIKKKTIITSFFIYLITRTGFNSAGLII